MSESEVVELMVSSKSEEEWNANCDKVKAACNGYPSFWFHKIVMSGLMATIKETWPKREPLEPIPGVQFIEIE